MVPCGRGVGRDGKGERPDIPPCHVPNDGGCAAATEEDALLFELAFTAPAVPGLGVVTLALEESSDSPGVNGTCAEATVTTGTYSTEPPRVPTHQPLDLLPTGRLGPFGTTL